MFVMGGRQTLIASLRSLQTRPSMSVTTTGHCCMASVCWTSWPWTAASAKGSGMFALAPGFMALLEGSDHRITIANQAFRELFGKTRPCRCEHCRKHCRNWPSKGLVDLLDETERSGEPFVGRAMPHPFLRPRRGITKKFRRPDVPAAARTPAADFPAYSYRATMCRRTRGAKSFDLPTTRCSNWQSATARWNEPWASSSGSSSRHPGPVSWVRSSCSIKDGKHLRHGAAPSLPQPYMEAIDGAEIGPCAGSCGTAAFTAAPVFVSDIAEDPLWADFKDVALPHGLRACWSIPILTRGRKASALLQCITGNRATPPCATWLWST